MVYWSCMCTPSWGPENNSNCEKPSGKTGAVLTYGPHSLVHMATMPNLLHLWPSCHGIQELFSSPLCDVTILKVGIDLAVGESLFPLQAVVNEGIVTKATIVSIVVFNGEKMIGFKSFKSLFCLEGFITGGTGHNLITVEAQGVVNKGSGYLLLLICQLVFELGYKHAVLKSFGPLRHLSLVFLWILAWLTCYTQYSLRHIGHGAEEAAGALWWWCFASFFGISPFFAIASTCQMIGGLDSSVSIWAQLGWCL